MNDRHPAGALVCVEGIDGAGKTTAAVAGAAEVLRQRGVPTVLVDKHHLTAGSAYARRHLRALAELIWAHPADDPYLEFGDMHWVQLQAAWYAGISRCGVGVILRAEHLCMTLRGVRAPEATTTTTALLGALSDKHHLRQEFLEG